MLRRHFWIIGIFTGLLFISSCSGTTPNSEDSMTNRNWGRSHGTAIYNQMLNPDAAKNLDPVEDLDGIAADNNVKKYEESFRQSEPQEVVNILKLQ
jgi:uncharacterized protein (DUF4213/DUF364 family)